jgi:hypothetical protein
MTKTKKLLASALGLAVTLGISGGALAASHSSKARSEPVAAADTDTVQQGDQTTPDTTTTSQEARSSESGSTGSEPSNEGQGSDGPGGHEDPAGNVDHQFDGQE